jgi:hypothetical protein
VLTAELAVVLDVVLDVVLAMVHPVVSTPYNFAGARRKYIPVGSSFASMRKTSPVKVYCALTTSFNNQARFANSIWLPRLI